MRALVGELVRAWVGEPGGKRGVTVCERVGGVHAVPMTATKAEAHLHKAAHP